MLLTEAGCFILSANPRHGLGKSALETSGWQGILRNRSPTVCEAGLDMM